MKIKIIHQNKEHIKVHFSDLEYPETEEHGEVEMVVSGANSDLSEEKIKEYPKLKYILNCCNGLNNIDLDYCKQSNIQVFNSPTANINATAEHTVTLILASLRKVNQADRSMRGGNWSRNNFLSREICESTIGFIGFGRIARLVNEKLSSFKPKQVVAYDPFLSQEQMDQAVKDLSIKVQKVELDQLIAYADIISLHLPLLDSTRNLISKNKLEQMGKGTILINSSRGGIIDESALITALQNNQIMAAALDVFENEPNVNSHLFEIPNLILTPHLGAMTKKAQDRMITEAKERFEESIKE